MSRYTGNAEKQCPSGKAGYYLLKLSSIKVQLFTRHLRTEVPLGGGGEPRPPSLRGPCVTWQTARTGSVWVCGHFHFQSGACHWNPPQSPKEETEPSRCPELARGQGTLLTGVRGCPRTARHAGPVTGLATLHLRGARAGPRVRKRQAATFILVQSSSKGILSASSVEFRYLLLNSSPTARRCLANTILRRVCGGQRAALLSAPTSPTPKRVPRSPPPHRLPCQGSPSLRRGCRGR